MATGQQDVVKQGYVKFQSKNLGNLGVWSKKWLMLRRSSCKGPVRLEKYKDEETASMSSMYGAKRKIIDLTRVERVDRLPESVRKHGITVVISNTLSLQFCAGSEMEAEIWLSAIRDEMHPENRQTHESFTVYMLPNNYLPTSGECTLQLERDRVRILDRPGGREIVVWPFTGVRRYGIDGEVFTLEAGSSCPSGDGEFHFRCTDSEFIYQRIQALAQALGRGGGGQNQSTPHRPSLSQSSWGNLTSLQQLSERRAGSSSSSSREENAYQLDDSFPKTRSTRRTDPLPSPPVASASTQGGSGPYSELPALNDPYSEDRREQGTRGHAPSASAYYARSDLRPAAASSVPPRSNTVAGTNASNRGASSRPNLSPSSSRDADVVRVEGPYYATSFSRTANEAARPAPEATGERSDRPSFANRTNSRPRDDVYNEPEVRPGGSEVRSVRVDGTYYAVSRSH